MFIAGIDGGGTHTRLEIRDMENRTLRREEFGPFNINSIGEAAFRNLLREVFAACGDMKDCAKICFGAAGISNPRMGEVLKEELDAVGFGGEWLLVGDQAIALRGAMAWPAAAATAISSTMAAAATVWVGICWPALSRRWTAGFRAPTSWMRCAVS